MPDSVIELLVENPLLLLFLVTAVGYPLGRIKVAGASLGVAAVLFVGLAVGALDPLLQLPVALFELGLVVFMYTIGISSGPGFVASLKGEGVRDNLFVLIVLVLAAGLAFAGGRLLHLDATVTAGLYAGSLTNTPALAGVLDSIARTAAPDQVDRLISQPAIGYSVAYPMGVLGMILVLHLARGLWRIDPVAEAARVKGIPLGLEKLVDTTILITRPEVTDIPLAQLVAQHDWKVVFGRLKRGDKLTLIAGETRLQLGDLLTVVGAQEDNARVLAALGEASDQHLEFDRSEYDFRRIFVSNYELVGRRLSQLQLSQRFDAIVTRVRRGDIDFLARGNTVLEPGDRVRVVARTERMPQVSKFFGDSYRQLSEIDITSFGLGIALGVLVGLIAIPLPGGGVFRLGFAGGPLVVAIILGALGRTGPIVWYLPYSANLTIRQIGLILLLASIGLRAGFTFRTTFTGSGGLMLFLAAAAVTVITALITVYVGYKLLKMPFGLLGGVLAGLGTQPATLEFAREQNQNDVPSVGYATVFPLATIIKIVLAQVLLLLS